MINGHSARREFGGSRYGFILVDINPKSCKEIWNKPEIVVQLYVISFGFIMAYTQDLLTRKYPKICQVQQP